MLQHQQKLATMQQGQTLLVGMNIFNTDGTWLRAEQVFGIIESLNAERVRIINQLTQELLEYPFIKDSIEPGQGGAYQFHKDAIPVLNPDFVATFKVTLSKDNTSL
ncbi:MAG TPA: hypothetical protein DHW71_15410 [Gammaproteobacteria bacterium]|nr:hypothetical protein [Gammaproteobacteria bacterium]MEC8012348.1 hypothetical protein [Pseudomonadota bacterium]HBF09105.1 hypothetical protein [Gammaproteobacteria bacterium]HCK94380.1 hypothetical protein [Gammaproteobacteria bacterium]|tara:strand:- start:265 stop:582 length:318 start_codon:yes stop_codon:yes gene_type:complete